MEGIRSHIVLVGFMGSGKSTVGRLLANSLNLTFIDMDDRIVQKSGQSINQLFAERGESYFRRLEQKVLQECLNREHFSIIATGGGAPCFHDNMKLINENSTSIYLKVGRRKLAHRLRNDNERPLLHNKNDKELFQFVVSTMSQRESFYSDADVTIRAIGDPSDLCKRIICKLKKKN